MITVSPSRDHKLLAWLNEEVQTLHAELHPAVFKPFDREATNIAIEGFLSDPACHCYVAFMNEEAIGYAIFFIREAKENAFHYTIRSLYIDQVCVLGKHRGTGAGKLLMDQAELLARENNIQQ